VRMTLAKARRTRRFSFVDCASSRSAKRLMPCWAIGPCGWISPRREGTKLAKSRRGVRSRRREARAGLFCGLRDFGQCQSAVAVHGPGPSAWLSRGRQDGGGHRASALDVGRRLPRTRPAGRSRRGVEGRTGPSRAPGKSRRMPLTAQRASQNAVVARGANFAFEQPARTRLGRFKTGGAPPPRRNRRRR